MAGTGENQMIRGHFPNDDHGGLIFCEGCKEMRPQAEFVDLEYQVGAGGDHGPEADIPIVVCKRCKIMGPPKLDPMAALTLPHANALKALAQGEDIPAAARFAGMKASQLRRILTENERTPIRVAWQQILRSKGITLDSIGDTLAEALQAKERKYHPGEEEFKEFPDERTRLAALRTAATFLRVDPPKEVSGKDGVQAVQVNITTTLGQNADAEVAGGYRVQVGEKTGKTIELEPKDG